MDQQQAYPPSAGIIGGDMTNQQALDNSDSNIDYDNMSDGGWIQWYCSLEGHEFLCEIEEDFIRDNFNMVGLKEKYPNGRFSGCLRMILSPYIPTEQDLADQNFIELNQEASDLYGMLHARYLHTARGMAKVYQKYLSGVYGNCPRVLCERIKALPIGVSDDLRVSRVKIFCPKCEQVYMPRHKSINLDGGYFGSSFPHVFLKNYQNKLQIYDSDQEDQLPKAYVPRIFGFKLVGKQGSVYKDKLNAQGRKNRNFQIEKLLASQQNSKPLNQISTTCINSSSNIVIPQQPQKPGKKKKNKNKGKDLACDSSQIIDQGQTTSSILHSPQKN